MREFTREGVRWSVRETARARGAPSSAPRCLIFDSESIVRRVWVYPEHWAELSDDQLWELASGLACVVPPVEPLTPTAMHHRPGMDRPAMVLAAEMSTLAQSLLAQTALLRASNRQLHQESRALRAACLAQRDQMRVVVETFAARMRVDGIAPEQALVRIKGAVEHGVATGITTDDPDAEAMLHEAVAWGIAAYYAA